MISRTVFAGGRVFDGTGASIAEADVAISQGRIVDIGSALDGDHVIDVSNKTILPGLFDCHTHVTLSHIDSWRFLQTPFSYRFYQAIQNLEATLAAGITTARDAGGADLGLKQALQDGLIRGPRLQISLTMLSQTGGHGDGWLPSGCRVQLFHQHPGVPDPIVDGTDAMRRKVRELVRMGADVIKVATSGGVMSPRDKPQHAHFRLDELEMLVAEANAAGKWVMAHAQASEGIKNAIRAGIRSIEHGIFLDDEAIDLMLQHGTYLVPTLIAPRGVLDAAAAGAAIPDESVAKAHEVIEVHMDSFARAVHAGVKIAMGTDSCVTPHGENLRELRCMNECGMKPEKVLAAATSTAAELMGLRTELGTLEPGKRGDLVIVDGDPLHLSDLGDRIDAVYQDGEQLVGESLVAERTG